MSATTIVVIVLIVIFAGAMTGLLIYANTPEKKKPQDGSNRDKPA